MPWCWLCDAGHTKRKGLEMGDSPEAVEAQVRAEQLLRAALALTGIQTH